MQRTRRLRSSSASALTTQRSEGGRAAVCAASLGANPRPALKSSARKSLKRNGSGNSLARGGLTEEKLKKVREPNPAVVDAITNLFTQGYGDFEWSHRSAQPPPTIEDFKRMEEAIFFQACVRNDLARRNLLRIGIGFLQEKNGKREDIGVVRRPCVSGIACEGAPRWLLYDRHGVAVPGAGGAFRDLEYRSVDLEKLKREAVFPIPVPVAPGMLVVRGVPILKIDVKDRNIDGFLRTLEQSLGGPPRELVALAASLFNYGLFIAREMHERNKAWVLAGRTIEFAAGVFGFFVIHAFAASLKASPHPAMKAASYLVMAMARAVGALLGVDLALTNMEKLALAGRHFAQMERLHRESSTDNPRSAPERSSGRQAGSKDPVEIPRLQEAKLTKLSRGHLEAGAEALLDAMAGYFALGVVLVGGVGVAKLRRMRATAREAKALQENIKNLEAEAHSKLKVSDDGVVDEIEPVKPAEKLEGVPAPTSGKPAKSTGGLGAEKPPADGKPKAEKEKPRYGEYFYKRCDALKKRVEVLKEHLVSLEMPSDSGRAQRLEELKTNKATYLLNSIELVRDSKGERVMPVLSKEVAEYEEEVAKEFPRPMPEAPPRDSEGLYVIQETGELQGQPQRGKVPEPRALCPQGISDARFAEAARILRSEAGHIGSDMFVHGSRAAGAARPDSDLNFGIRVSEEQFARLVVECFGFNRHYDELFRVNLTRDVLRVGRGPDNDVLVLGSDRLPQQFCIEESETSWVIQDRSRKGLEVDGQVVREANPRNKSEIDLLEWRAVFELSPERIEVAHLSFDEPKRVCRRRQAHAWEWPASSRVTAFVPARAFARFPARRQLDLPTDDDCSSPSHSSASSRSRGAITNSGAPDERAPL